MTPALALAILTLLGFTALLAAAEAALNAASKGKLRALADKGSRPASRALALAEDGEHVAVALLLATTLAQIGMAALLLAALPDGMGAWGIAAALVGLALVVLLLAGMLPKALAVAQPEPFAMLLAPLVLPIVAIARPITAPMRLATGGVLRALGIAGNDEARTVALREDIAETIAIGHSEGVVEKEARDRLLGALDLTHRTVDEIMRHRRDIEMIDADNAPDAILTQALASSHTRLPIWRDSPENIIGVIHAKDLLREVDRLLRAADGAPGAIDALDVAKIAMKPYFIPETTTLDEQMREFLKRRTHFALVVDEYGAIQGLITLEDILEEIVGEIRDEFDTSEKEPRLQPDETGAYAVEGAMTIRDLNRALDWQLPDDEANTIAGLVIHEAQTIPQEGQAFSFHGFRFEVVQRRENRITRLRIRPL